MKTIAFLLAICAALSCSENKAQSNKTSAGVVEIQALKYMDSHNIEDFIQSINLIPLETTDESLINYVGKVVRSDDEWYVGGLSEATIKSFSKDGKFITEIGNKGNGPGESLQITDFFVSEGTVNLFAWSANRKWIRRNNDNTFLYETNMNLPFGAAYKVDNDNFLLHVGNGVAFEKEAHYLYLADKDLMLKKRFFKKSAPFDINYSSYQQNFSTGSDNDILYLRDYHDTIYSISNKIELAAKYHLDFGNAWYSEEFFEENYKKNLMEIHRNFYKKEYPRSFVYNETPKYFLLSYYKPHEGVDYKYLSLFEKESNKTYNFSNNESVLLNLLADMKGCSKGEFFSSISAMDFIELVSSLDKENFFYNQLNDMAKKLSADDNPLLILFKLK